MRFQTVVRDCLYLNWAVPREALADPPPPLRYECHAHAGRSWVFVSALLFHQSGLKIGPASLPWLSYPQVNVRCYVTDGGTPAVLFYRMLVPRWLAPGVRAASRLPCGGARLRLARPSLQSHSPSWDFDARTADGSLCAEVRPGSAPPADAPALGSWSETTDYFRMRDRGFARVAGGLRRIDTEHETVPLWPVVAEVREEGLVTATLRCREGAVGVLHSAWLCPEIPLSLVTRRVTEPVLSRRLPATG